MIPTIGHLHVRHGNKVKMVKKFVEIDLDKCKLLDYDEFRQKFMFNRVPECKKVLDFKNYLRIC